LNPKSILIIKPGSLGDIIHTLPAIASLREAHPHAEITWVINPELAPLLRGNPDVDHVYFTQRGEFRGLGAPRSLLTWLKKTRAIRPDLALDFQGVMGSVLTAKISGAKEVCGMSSALAGASWFYDRVARVDRRGHAVERYLKLVECAGATVGESLRCSVPSGDPLPRFDAHPPFVLLHPFARGQDKSLLQLIWLIRVARFVISVESGPMHIAAAVNPNLLSIHSWSDPSRIGPYNPDAWVWKHGQLFRVGELETARIRKHGRRFRRKDVASVVELIRPLVPIDPMVA